MNESGMFFVDATYDNSDAKCSRDDEIVLLIQSNFGEVRSRNDCCDHRRCIIGFFPGRFGAERAVKASIRWGSKLTFVKTTAGTTMTSTRNSEPMHTVAIGYHNSDGQFRHDAHNPLDHVRVGR